MKMRILVLVVGFLFIGINGFAADGDLIVNGNATVNGTVIIGHEIVSVACTGTLCTATCSSGKQVIGGGCALSGASILYQNYPSSSTTWTCRQTLSIYQIAYAICARVD